MENFEEIVKKIMSTPTSPKDLFNIAGKRCNVFEYPEIKDFDDIEDLFEAGNSDIESLSDLELPFDKKSAIILYKSSPNFGHWTIIKKVGGAYHFLDSYGDVIDDELKHSDKSFNKLIGQDRNYLSKLLLGSGKDVYYNHNPLQKLDEDIATCGLYCALFLKYNNLKVDDFAKMIKKLSKDNKVSHDVTVALLTLV
jgi:frataxin-like iron-binding protein CyaY